MKYIAIIDTDNELTEDAIKNLVNDTVFIGDEAASYCFTMTSIRKLSEVAPSVKAISIDRLKAFRNEVMNMNDVAIIHRLDKLIAESEGKDVTTK